jgi:hypothetical protein
MLNPNDTTDENKDLPYDLRQIYANDILGEHLKDVARARKMDNFNFYFKCLKDVYIVTQHKFKKDKREISKDKDGKEIKITPEDKYKELMNKIVVLANKYPDAFLGKSQMPDERAIIEEALNNVEMFLYNKIEEAKIFGSSREIRGL